MDLSNQVRLGRDFSMLPVARNSPSEKTLLDSLFALDPVLAERSEPAAIPVFGRARALAVMIGEEISDQTVFEACTFLTGPCSCQVKYWNPGFDLFMPVDWDAVVTGMIGVDEALPPLTVPTISAAAAGGDSALAATDGAAPGPETGTDAAAEAPADEEALATTGAEEAPEESVQKASPLVRNLILVGVLGLLVVGAISWVTVRARGGQS